MAVTEAVKEGIWLRGMLKDFGCEQSAITIFCDSQSALHRLHLTKHQMFHERSKHIDVRHLFVRDIVNKGVVKVVKISTEHNPANMCWVLLTSSNERSGINYQRTDLDL